MEKRYRGQRPSYRASSQEMRVEGVIRETISNIVNNLDVMADALSSISPDRTTLMNSLNNIDSKLRPGSLNKQVFDFIEQGLRL